jgi:TRAP-type C4-dicarboxylate transport system substrate-binding protein
MIENEEKLLEELAAIEGAEVHQIDTAPFEAHAQAVTDQFIDADPLIVEFVEASKKAIEEIK